jgi:enamine deaminase RidA (YjgF/YER057c/UK114 family)
MFHEVRPRDVEGESVPGVQTSTYARGSSNQHRDPPRRGRSVVTRTDINPWEWSTAFGFSQAVEITQADRILICSGQTAIPDDGTPPESPDMGEQVKKAFDNLGSVLHTAGMRASNVVRVNYYTTDVDELIAVLGPLAAEFFGDNLPASTLLGVARLAFPQLKIEIEAVAAA